ncbi:3-deoxy-D-manno-octulosonic acid kinase [Haliea sp. E1-2-M8]|uniref:3-deoxy-D-manno-octulosonic acid kinase n=1 Tax=Haliea sp. E1-2-M8 TaxID=3064706 RepID=UPI00272109E7|nr:3-deoxy-D-manno-octulosonic acid kinase [Haliea sp. E1-2-M8]MDO8860325.1 3-deoxy-D-manno-octulosonic acid kinase [Haliea sp. E1-2-M8]
MNSSTEAALITGSSALLCNPAFNAVTGDWLDPGFWGDRARLVASGGRGGAWYISASEGEFVLRRYLRGGLVARLSRASYVFTGFNNTRSLREFRLLLQLRARGLPVPEPVAALARRSGLLFWQGAILLRRIPRAHPLPESPALGEVDLWSRVGELVRRFHDAGLDHADLNCDNILEAGEDLWLIDFDRCRLRPGSGPQARWKQSNLRRLRRSVAKRCRVLPPERQEELWQQLLQAYAASGGQPGRPL